MYRYSTRRFQHHNSQNLIFALEVIRGRGSSRYHHQALIDWSRKPNPSIDQSQRSDTPPPPIQACMSGPCRPGEKPELTRGNCYDDLTNGAPGSTLLVPRPVPIGIPTCQKVSRNYTFPCWALFAVARRRKEILFEGA